MEDGREKARYDIDKGQLIVQIPKENKGEFFENLDMLTQLLAKKKPNKQNPLIEVLPNENGEIPEVEEEDEDEDYEFEQTVPEDSPLSGLSSVHYGFNNQYTDFFTNLQEDLSEILTIPNPDSIPRDTWRAERIQREDDQFDPDHYMADLMMDDEIKALLKYTPQVRKDLKKKKQLKRKRDAEQATTQDSDKSKTEQDTAQTTSTPASTLTPASLAFLSPASLISLATQATPDTPATETTNSTESSAEKTDSAEPSKPETTTENKPEEKNDNPEKPDQPEETSKDEKSEKDAQETAQTKEQENSETKEATNTPKPMVDLEVKYSKQAIDEQAIQFSDADRETLMRLPNKECIIIAPSMNLRSLIFKTSFPTRKFLCWVW